MNGQNDPRTFPMQALSMPVSVHSQTVTQRRRTLLDGVGDLVDEAEDGLHDGPLELEAALLPQDVGQK
jgi:hypothetical protein